MFNKDTFLEYQGAAEPEKARLLNVLVKDNIALVQKLSGRIYRAGKIHADMDDVIQAGCIGLMRAFERYDTTKGTAFSTYAAFWIRHEIQTALIKETKIHRPRNSGMPYKIFRAVDAFTALHGRDPLPEEVGATAKEWAKWEKEHLEYIPLDAPCETGDRGARFSSIQENVSDDAPSALESLEIAQLAGRLGGALDVLDARERRIIEGLFMADKTPEAIACEENVTAERVRQIRDEALATMKDALT